MRSSIACVIVAVASVTWNIDVSNGAQTVTLDSLLQEMVNREALPRLPLPSYTCRQSSSYDRDAISPDNQETWYANWDRSQFIRIEQNEDRKEYVMHDAEGPGAIVRIWATWHGPGGGEFSNGTLRFYFDRETTPRIEGPITEILDQGRLAGPPLAMGVPPEAEYHRRGHNLYLPIPYAKHCKITYSTEVPIDRGAKEGEALYYQINYRTYEPDTKVESFSQQHLAAAESTINEVNQRLVAGRRDQLGDWETIEPENGVIELSAKSSSAPIRLQGPGAIRSLQCRLIANNLEQALRSTVLEMEFDGEQTVWCPIGDFFGTGYQLSPHGTWYTHVDEEGLMATAWIMPFEREAVITIQNVGDQEIQIADCQILQSDWLWDDRSMHFHATWQQMVDRDTGGNKNMSGHGASDINYVTVHGRGVYVGDTLTLHNGAPAWWGEGDEKIYVDGESFPSHFGTGTEDYYGYAWSRSEFFEAPFHAQPDGSGNMAGGYAVNSRYRALDAIPFSESIQLDMELWHWVGTKINYAPATFWYARPGVTCNVKPTPESARLAVITESGPRDPVHKVAGVLEGEALKIVERTGGQVQVQHAPFGWSGDRQLWWIDGKVGDKLVISFPVEDTGDYKLQANLTKANDYGIVKVTIDDNESLYFDQFHFRVEHEVCALGAYKLEQGDHRLTIELVGTHPDAIPRHMFGLDYLELDAISNE